MSQIIDNAVAIVGMSCKLPVAQTPEQFWQALAKGVEAVRFLSDEELRRAGVSAARLADPHYVKAAVPLPGRQLFDAAFFGITPREASLMDPQQRLLLEGAYHALEHAGHVPDQNGLETGVFVGADVSSYFVQNVLPHAQAMADADQVQCLYTNSSHATQIAYRLNLKGPCLDVNTACSTSLVAVHLACRSLLMYECDMALAGGASVQASEPAGYQYRADSILSPDGHCRAFDADAAGTVPGQGVALVVLKRHGDALRDGNTVYALIRGTAINNDGSNKIGYTAPSVEGQVAVLRRALAMAELEPGQVGYVECHGTGTALGDPIELTALAEVYGGDARPARSACYLGSLKTNLGHLNSAAGVAGLIKTSLCLHRRQLPPSLNFSCPTPKVSWSGMRLAVNTRLRDWTADTAAPLRASVSSFGIGGTNAHAVLEAVTPEPAGAREEGPVLLTLSAKTERALARKRCDFAAFLRDRPETSLADACYTANIGRSRYAYRHALVATDRQHCIEQLLDAPAACAVAPCAERVLVLHDGGEALLELGRALYADLKDFRRALAAVQAAGFDPQAILAPGTAAGPETSFGVLYGLLAICLDWLERPSLLVCDRSGELAAACHAGVLGFGDAWALACADSGQPSGLAIDQAGSPPRRTSAGVRFTSSLDGAVFERQAECHPGYWHAPRTPVAFTTALQAAVGSPEASLAGFAGCTWRKALTPAQRVRSFDASACAGGRGSLLALAGWFWQHGGQLHWPALYSAPLRRVAIPGYPFESIRHWLDAPAAIARKVPPAPEFKPRPLLRTPYVAPRSELEEDIARIWSQSLGIEQVGVTDEFFDLGGHSLVATQIHARIHETFGIQLTLEDLFDAPTVAGTVDLLLRRQLAELKFDVSAG